MLKKTIRRLGALAMVLAMAVSVFAVNASAAGAYTGGDDGLSTITLTKKLQVKESGALAPNVTASFSVTPVTVAANTTKTVGTGENAKTYTVNSGVAGGLYFNDTSTSKDSEINFAQGDTVSTGYVTKTTSLTVGKEVLIKAGPGIYRYKVTETAVDGDTGVTKSSAEYYVDVYVAYVTKGEGEAATQVLQVIGAEALAVTKNGEVESTAKSDLEFTNVYDSLTMTVTKKVTGGMGNKAHEWEIEVTVWGNDSTKTFATDKTDASGKNIILTSGVAHKFYLADGQSVKIYGLSKDDTVTVKETDEMATRDGYNISGQLTTVDDAGKGTTKITTENQNVTIENKLPTVSPTGVIMTIAPYALMVVVAGAFAVVFLSRRNRAE